MAHIPHRRQLVERLREYPFDHAQFLELTRQEYDLAHKTPPLPIDSVQTARIDGMPQAKVAMVSEPTLRIVITREAIRERLVARQIALDAKLTPIVTRLEQFWDWWRGPSTDIQRKFVELRYWNRASYQEVQRYFRAHEENFYGWVPDTEDKVMRFEDDLLAFFDRLWYPPANHGAEKSRKNAEKSPENPGKSQ